MVAVIAGGSLGLERSSAWVLGSRGQLGQSSLGRSGENVYVNAVTGNLVIQRTDEMLIGTGPDNMVGRTHNSLATTDGDNNDNWRTSVHRTVTYDSVNDKVTRTNWDGSEDVYDKDGSIYVFKGDGDSFDTLSWDGTKWTWTDGASQTTEIYDTPTGTTFRLAKRKDTDGNELEFNYTNGLVTRVKNLVTNEYTDLTYAASTQNLTEVVTHYGTGAASTLTRVRYTYDGSNRLETVTVDLNPEDNNPAAGGSYVTTYSYDGASDRVSRIVQTDGTLLDIDYDTVGGVERVVSYTQTSATGVTRMTTIGYDTTNRVTTVTDPAGVKTLMTYDTLGQLIRIEHCPPGASGGTPAPTAPPGGYTYVAGTSTNNVIDGGTGSDAIEGLAGNDTLRGNDGNDWLNGGIGADNMFGGNGTDVLIGGVDNDRLNGGASADIYVFSPGGGADIITTSQFSQAQGDKIDVSAFGDSTQSKTIAQVGADTVITFADGSSVKIEGFTATLLSNSDFIFGSPADNAAVNRILLFSYDASGNVLTFTENGQVTVYEYDARGNRVLERDSLGNTVRRTYSTANQLLRETHYVTPDPGDASSITPSNPLTTRFVYDGEQHLRFVISAEGRVTEFRYNTAGQQISAIEYLANLYPIGGLAEGVSPTEYDVATTWLGTFSDKSTTRRTDTTYDPLRGTPDIVTTYSKVLTSGAGDTASEMTQVKYVYDTSGQLKLRQELGSTLQETYIYDGLWRMTSSTDFNGLLTEINFQDSASTTVVTVGSLISKTSVYNRAGELITYSETATGLSTPTATYRYDNLGRLRGKTDPVGVKTFYLYDRLGRLVAEIDGNGSMVEYVYDANNLVTRTVRYKTAVGASLLTQLDGHTGNQTYDADDYRPTADAADKWEWRVYDDAKRIVQIIDAAGAVTSFEFDGASRLVKTTAYVTTVAVAGLKTSPPTDPVTTTSNGADRIDRQFYDADNRLVGTLDAEGYLTKNIYDGAGMLIETIAYADDTTTTHRASGTWDQLFGTIVASNSLDVHNWSVYDKRGQLLIAINGEGDVTRYHYTALGDLDLETRGQKLSSTELNTLISTAPTLTSIPAAAGGTIIETTAWKRDQYGKVLSETRTLAGGVLETDHYLYDSFGRLMSVTTASSTADARTTSYLYDNRGRLIGELSGEGSRVVGDYTNWTYDQTLTGAGTNDTLTGDKTRSLIRGYDGVDTLSGAEGDDRLEGGIGADVLNGGAGNDILIGGADSDSLTGGAGRDIFVFASGDGTDTIWDFQVGIDLIDLRTIGAYSLSTVGSDTLVTLNNGGTITVKGVALANLTAANFLKGAYATVYTGTSGNNTQDGGVGRDLLVGLGGVDTLDGKQNDDRIDGGAGADILRGDDGNDILIGGADNDTLTGGAGRDIFVAQASNGADTIMDFQLGVDLLDLQAVGAYTLSTSGSDVLVTFTGGTILVKSVTVGALTASHFLTSTADTYKAFGTTYAYDDADRLISKIEPGGAGAGTGLKTLYYYNVDGQLTHEINPLGEIVEYRYDTFGRRTDVLVHGARLSAGTLATLTGGLVNSTLLTAMPSDSLASKSTTVFNVTDTVSQVTDADNITTSYAYNAFREATSRTTPLSRVDTFAFDRRGLNTQQILDVTGIQATTSFTYDAFGNAITSTDPDGKVRSTSYDRVGRTATTTDAIGGTTTAYTYDGRGAVTNVKDRLNNNTIFAYTAFNRTVTMTTPESVVTTTQNNAYGQAITITDGASRVMSYSYDTDGNLIRSANSQANQVVDYYDTAGRLSFTVDARGTKTTFTYDAASRVLRRKVDDGGLGLETIYVFDAKGQTTVVTDPSGRETAYTYSAGGKVLTITRDPSVLALVTKFEYDARGRQYKITEGFGVSGVARLTQYGFDLLDRQTTSQVDPAGLNLTTNITYDKRGNAVAKTDAAGGVTRYVYDDENRLVWTVDPVGGVSKTSYDAEGRVTATLAYNQIVSLTGWPLAIAESQITGVPLNTSSSDQKTAFVYDKDGRLTYTVDALLRVVQYVYDGSGNVIRKVAYATPIAATTSYTITYVQGQVVTNAADRTQHALFDTAGRQIYSIDAMGSVVVFTYDKAGNVVRSVRMAEAYTTAGNPTLSAMDTWVSTRLAATGNRIDRSVYDAAGRVTFTIDAETYVTEIKYDPAGNVTKTRRFLTKYTPSIDPTDSDMATWRTTNSLAGDAIDRTMYDGAGRIVYAVDAETYVTKFEYDATGNLLQTTRFWDRYGSFGDNTTASNVDATIPTIPASAAVTKMTYDLGGRMLTQVRGFGAPEVSTTTYTYDGVGRVRTITNGRGAVTEYVYDAAGQVTFERVQLSSGVIAETGYQYDAFGNRVKVTDPLTNIGYFYYDSLNRLTLQVDPEGYATKTTHSLGGEPISVTRYLVKSTNAYSVTVLPTLTTDTSKMAVTVMNRDKLDRVTSVVDAEGKAETYELNTFGDRIRVWNRKATATTVTDPHTFYTYDRRGLMVAEELWASSFNTAGTAVTTRIINTFAYDSRGNLTTKIEADNTGPTGRRTTTYEYDKLDRLLREIGDSVAVLNADLTPGTAGPPMQEIIYDSRNNIRQSIDANGNRTAYWYDELDRKIAEVSPLGTLSKWDYDLANNATVVKVYADAVSPPGTTWDVAVPTPVDANKLRTTTNTYDLNNRLLTSSVAGLRTGEYGTGSYSTAANATVTTQRVYDALGNVIQEIDGRGNSIFHFFDKAGRQIGKVDQEKYVTAYVVDAEGNVTKETRYATQLSGAVTVTTTSSMATLTAGLAATGDRVTEFEYDKNGRRKIERRLDVVAYDINTTNGNLTVRTGPNAHAEVKYFYNELGQIVQKVEANGDTTDYSYDAIGRQTKIEEAGFTDYAAASVRNTTEIFYDGLNNVVRTREGKATANSAIDHITTYTYGAGGRLATMTSKIDDLGLSTSTFTHYYGYDKAGNLVMDRYLRLQANGSTVSEANAYKYDAKGRVIQQATATDGSTAKDGSGPWTFGDKTHLRYNVYGEVTGKGITAGSETTPVYQETFEYDTAGRMWRSNTGDGSTRLFMYDKNGAVTLTIAAVGTTNLTTYTDIEAALTGLGVNPATGAASSTAVAPTITVYDKRGQAVATRENYRQLTSSGTSNIVKTRTYNAFGEVKSETDARGNAAGSGFTYDFSYNTMGRLIQKQSPTVSATAENGGASNLRPTETYFFDISGRMIGIEDANSNINSRILLAGSGHGKEDAIVVVDFHAGADDTHRNGKFKTEVDVFGDVRKITDELDRVRTQDFDLMGRLVKVTAPERFSTYQASSVEEYGYDGLGQRITRWNNQLGSTKKEETWYDRQGRVVKLVDYADHETSYDYVWKPTMATTGMGTFGGWEKTTHHVSGRTAIENADYFGHMVSRTDLGGNVYTMGYNAAGRMATQTNTLGQNLTMTYYNTGLISGITDAAGNLYTYYTSNIVSAFSYDLDGNRTKESYVGTYYSYDEYGTLTTTTTTHQDATVTYDALNRMVTYTDPGQNGANPVTINYTYDANSNIRRVLSTYYEIGTTTTRTQDYWYAYDNMNRFVTTMGVLVGTAGSGTIQRGYTGFDVTYDLAGQRTSVTNTVHHESEYQGSIMTDPGTSWDPPTYESVFATYDADHVESYVYSEDGYLLRSYKQSEYWTNWEVNGGYLTTGDNFKISETFRDNMGRITSYVEYAGPQVITHIRNNIVYSDDSRVLSEHTETVRYVGFDLYVDKSDITYYFGLNDTEGSYSGAYQGGNVSYIRSSNTTLHNGNTTSPTVSGTTMSYIWRDDARQSSTAYRPDVTKPSIKNSTFSYDVNGHLSSVYVNDGRPRTITYTTDANGQILTRQERDNNNSQGDPKDLYYYFSGIRVGDIGNNGPSQTDYATAIYRRYSPSTNPWRNGAEKRYADFDQSYDPINAGVGNGSNSSITVRDGDTLQSIAQNVWGDASLWYMIASANGMNGSEQLAAGQTLSIPAKVVNFHNNSETYRVYDPNDAIGNTSPTTPKPPSKPGGCGVVGAIILIIIAIVVAVVSWGTLTGASYGIAGPAFGILGSGGVASGFGAAVAAGAISAAAGSIVSQAVGVATGIQDEFSWEGVALAALGGAIGGGLGIVMPDKIAGSAALAAGVRGATGSIITQGVAVSTGLQDRFDWTSVAVAGIAAGVSKAVSGKIADTTHKSFTDQGFTEEWATKWTDASTFGQNGVFNASVSGAAGALAGAAARTLADGSSFKDNIVAVLPDIVGSTIGNLITSKIVSSAEAALRDKILTSSLKDAVPGASVEGSIGSSNPVAQGRGLLQIEVEAANAPQNPARDERLQVSQDFGDAVLTIPASPTSGSNKAEKPRSLFVEGTPLPEPNTVATDGSLRLVSNEQLASGLWVFNLKVPFYEAGTTGIPNETEAYGDLKILSLSKDISVAWDKKATDRRISPATEMQIRDNVKNITGPIQPWFAGAINQPFYGTVAVTETQSKAFSDVYRELLNNNAWMVGIALAPVAAMGAVYVATVAPAGYAWAITNATTVSEVTAGILADVMAPGTSAILLPGGGAIVGGGAVAASRTGVLDDLATRVDDAGRVVVDALDGPNTVRVVEGIPDVFNSSRIVIEGFDPPPTFFNRDGVLTNGKFTIDIPKTAVHRTGQTDIDKSQFLYRVDVDTLLLDAASYAQANNLWKGGKAVIAFSRPIGVHARTGQVTSKLNLYVTKGGYVHGAPGSPPR